MPHQCHNVVKEIHKVGRFHHTAGVSVVGNGITVLGRPFFNGSLEQR